MRVRSEGEGLRRAKGDKDADSLIGRAFCCGKISLVNFRRKKHLHICITFSVFMYGYESHVEIS